MCLLCDEELCEHRVVHLYTGQSGEICSQCMHDWHVHILKNPIIDISHRSPLTLSEERWKIADTRIQYLEELASKPQPDFRVLTSTDFLHTSRYLEIYKEERNKPINNRLRRNILVDQSSETPLEDIAKQVFRHHWQRTPTKDVFLRYIANKLEIDIGIQFVVQFR